MESSGAFPEKSDSKLERDVFIVRNGTGRTYLSSTDVSRKLEEFLVPVSTPKLLCTRKHHFATQTFHTKQEATRKKQRDIINKQTNKQEKNI